MGFFRKRDKKEVTRIFFATDIHGSEKCFRKFINAGKFYGADILVLGGDLTGKSIVPIVEQKNGVYTCMFMGQERIVKTQADVQKLEDIIKFSGCYPYRTDSDTMEKIAGDKSKVDQLFTELMIKTLQDWIKLAEERLMNTGIKMYVTGGNDDSFAIDSVIKNSKYVIDPESDVVRLNETYEMLSSGWSNPTPWKTPRECNEDELFEKLEKLTSKVENMNSCIFNLHAPPKGTDLGTCVELDASVYPPKPIMEGGSPKLFDAGSMAVRKLIEKHQPMLGLHGHIHESSGVAKIGRTVCINPGSEYGEGILRGVIVDLDDKGIRSYQLTSG